MSGSLRGVERHGIVAIERRLLPGVEHNLLERMVGMQSGHDALDGIVKQHAADAPGLDAELRRGAEERLVLPNRFALVVVDFRAGSDPSGIGYGRGRIVEIERSGFRLALGLRLAGEAVGIDEMQLHARLLARREVADIGLPRNRCGGGGHAIEVVKDAGRRSPEMRDGEVPRRLGVEIALDCVRREVRNEIVERIAFDGTVDLSHHRGSRDHAQGVETGLGAIAVGVDQACGLKHAIIELGVRLVAGGVARHDRHEVEDAVIADDRRVTEWIDIAVRQEEMPHGEIEFIVRRVGRIKHPAGRNPEGSFPVDVAIASVSPG